jgi:triacylglycerol esterase/lipase EstA (alpha/beta hydrolase family)
MRYFYSLALLIVLSSCERLFQDIQDPQEVQNWPYTVSPFGCDTCRYPVVMVHGFLASGDTYAPFVQLFHSNGYKPNYLYAFDWNSLNQGANNSAALDAFIDTVRARTGQL